MQPRLAPSISLALLLLLLACNDEGDGGISVEAACDVYCTQHVECTVDDPVDEDNVMEACMTICGDQITDVEQDHPDDRDCEQAIREYYRCLGVEGTCMEFESSMFSEETCRSELFDVAEFCENGV
jgi:hypothetical protein